MYVEQYCKTEDNKWLLSEYNKAISMLSLTSIPFQTSLKDLYNKVIF